MWHKAEWMGHPVRQSFNKYNVINPAHVDEGMVYLIIHKKQEYLVGFQKSWLEDIWLVHK